MYTRKGQGSTEYLVLLAVVLIVAMVAISLLSYFPSTAGESKNAQADLYWRGGAFPFQVLDHDLKSYSGGNSTLSFIVLNADPDQKELINATFAGTGISGSKQFNLFLSPGEKKLVHVLFSGASCTEGSGYEIKTNFTYANADGSGQKMQKGAQPLAGKCSIGLSAGAVCPNNFMVCGSANQCACVGSRCVEDTYCAGATDQHCDCGQACVNNACQ